jgi:catechol 2,3-dioxygenase-like lactoylglutathione lyase family enzyme
MEANRRKTLHPAYRVADLDISLGFYTALGYSCSAASTSVTAPR